MATTPGVEKARPEPRTILPSWPRQLASTTIAVDVPLCCFACTSNCIPVGFYNFDWLPGGIRISIEHLGDVVAQDGDASVWTYLVLDTHGT